MAESYTAVVAALSVPPCTPRFPHDTATKWLRPGTMWAPRTPRPLLIGHAYTLPIVKYFIPVYPHFADAESEILEC